MWGNCELRCTMLAVLCLISAACGREAAPAEEEPRPVRYQEVRESGDKATRTFSGTSKAATQTRLSFRVNGVVATVAVKVGQRIKKGDLVAALDQSDAKLQLEQAEAAENNARVGLQTEQANLARVRALYENNNVALSEYETAKNRFAAAQANYESNKKSTRLRHSQLDYFRLHSPMDGIIGMVAIEKNENVAAGATVAELNSEGDMEVLVGVPEAYIAQIKTGEPVTVRFATLSGRTVPATISEVSYAIDHKNQTYPVAVTLVGPPAEVRPGMAAEVDLNFSAGDAAGKLTVPAQSVAEDQSGHFVYVVTPSGEGVGVVNRRAIVIGKLTGEGFYVLEGLRDGERVVTAGVNRIHDGLTVKLVP